MQPTRDEFAAFYKKTVGAWNSTRRNVSKWIDRGYKQILEWGLPLDMIAIEVHQPKWLKKSYAWNMITNTPINFNPNRTELEKMAIRVGYNEKKKENGYNGKGAWYIFPKAKPMGV